MSQQDQIEVMNELTRAHEYIQDLERERDLREQFVSILTHDLRTPLTAAKMAAQIIARRPERIEKTKQLIEKVIGSIDRMDQMIRDLLDANRIRVGEPLAMMMGECDLRNIATDTLRELSMSFGDRFMLETDRESICGYWNAEGVRRVLENLVNNAAKYGKPNELIKVILKQVDHEIQIIVHNLGNPISPEDLKCLFQPFCRTSTAQHGDKRGWGLGLTLVRGVAEAHGGKVSVESNEMDGTTFTVTLPRDARPYQLLH